VRRIVTVIGTRPEIIKMAPLIPRLDAACDHRFVFSNQHYSRTMVDIFLEEMEVRSPDFHLHVDSSDPERLRQAIAECLAELAPDAVIVYGDTNSTLAAAQAAPAGAAVCHIEAGIRSFDSRMPEERNRIETDRLSHWRLAPTGLASYFLTDFEGYDPATVKVVGNLVVDAYRRFAARIAARPLPAGLSPRGYYLLTMHRTENVDDPERLKRLLDNLALLGKPVVFPVHPRTERRMREFGLRFPENLRCSEPLGYFDFMQLFRNCDVIITDSGGVQEEAITLGAPCVTLRDNTERMETVFLGANALYDADRRLDLDRVVAGMAEGRERIRGLRNPYGDGDAAERIMSFLSGLT